MSRIIAVIILLLAAAGVLLWQLDVISLGSLDVSRFNRGSQQVYETLDDASVADINALLREERGLDLVATSREGYTPLMEVAARNPEADVTRVLVDATLNAGGDLNHQNDTGMSALMLAARDNRNPEVLLMLLNAGADPTLRDNEGKTAYDHGADNGSLRRSRLYSNLEYLSQHPFNPRWGSGYNSPIDGATFSSRQNHLPNSPRRYRNGVHQGFDFFNGVASVPVDYGTPVRSIARGTIVRVDHEYIEFDENEYNAIIDNARVSPITPEDSLDRLRGKQVWVRHAGGYISRYAHLSETNPNVGIGDVVNVGQIIGYVGNSGTIEAAQQTQSEPHLHFEFWDAQGYLGEDLPPQQIYELVVQVFGKNSEPPFTDSQ